MPDRVATITFEEKDNWTNKHLNVTQAFDRLYYIRTPAPRDGALIVEDMKATATVMQQVLGDAIAAGTRLRCLGGGWSLSNAAVTDGWLLSTKSLNLYTTVGKRDIHTTYPGDITNLYLAQCGVSIQELNIIAERDGKSLITCGASNGQTIAGAISTGTHGSAFRYGSMTEYVVGLHIVTGPQDVIWLERSGYPVISDSFATELGVTIVKDDDLFNAALVSFGSFGIIVGVMIETESKYLFEAQRFRLDLDNNLRHAMDTMDLSQLQLPHRTEIPWHFEVTFNPHDTAKGYARTLYKRPYADHPIPTQPAGQLGPGESLLSIIGTITGAIGPGNVARIMSVLIERNLKPGPPELGTCGEIFTLTTLRGKAMSMEIGIAMEDSSRVLDLLLGLHPELDVYAGVISYRWVKQSTAMLGFTKFTETATIEFNAAHTNRTLEFYKRVWQELERNKIPFTLHWGQMHNFTPTRVRKMYGDVVDRWIDCRNRLLAVEVREVFSSKFLKSTGLG